MTKPKWTKVKMPYDYHVTISHDVLVWGTDEDGSRGWRGSSAIAFSSVEDAIRELSACAGRDVRIIKKDLAALGEGISHVTDYVTPECGVRVEIIEYPDELMRYYDPRSLAGPIYRPIGWRRDDVRQCHP